MAKVGEYKTQSILQYFLKINHLNCTSWPCLYDHCLQMIHMWIIMHMLHFKTVIVEKIIFGIFQTRMKTKWNQIIIIRTYKVPSSRTKFCS